MLTRVKHSSAHWPLGHITHVNTDLDNHDNLTRYSSINFLLITHRPLSNNIYKMADLKALDKFFEDKTFINGERLSVADYAFVSSVKHVYEKALGNQSKAMYTNFNRYYNTITNQPGFKNLENLELFKKQEPTQSAADIMDALEKAESKPKDAFAVLPKTTFDFDDYKRMFSNNPPEKYLPYFWEKFDAQNCSIWLCDYKYNEDLNLVFMSSNLVRGALQRLDKARKQSFGSMVVFGEDKSNIIAGLWVWRGQDLMFKLTEDWQVDYESYEWKKLDPKSDETKKLVELFFKQDEGTVYKGKKLADAKIFK